MAVTIFGLMEIPFRLIPKPYYQQEGFRSPKPYVMFTGKPNAQLSSNPNMLSKGQKGETTRLNNLGFRIARDFPKYKPNHETRIFVLGGSTVFNGNSLVNTIPGQIEERFRRDGFTDVKVYNFGAASYVSGQELSLLLHILTDYEPDLVIVYDGANDVWQPYRFDPRPGYPYDFMVYEEGLRRMRGQGLRFTQRLSSLLYRSKLIRTLFGWSLQKNILPIAQIQKDTKYKSESWEMEIVDEYINNLNKMCGIARGFNFKLIVFFQPIIHCKQTLAGEEENLLGGKEFRGYIARQYARIRNCFAELDGDCFENCRCFYVDMSSVLNGYQKETYWDLVHTDNEGNEFIASKIYSFIQGNGVLSPVHVDNYQVVQPVDDE